MTDGEEPRGDALDGPQEPTSGEAESSERDWDAEWRSLTGDLLPGVRGSYRMGDLPVIGAGQGPRDYSPPEVIERWEPADPGPATASTATRLAWAGIAGGPLLMVLALVAFHEAPGWFVAICLAIFVAGCVLGFRQLPQRRRDYDDDGAAV